MLGLQREDHSNGVVHARGPPIRAEGRTRAGPQKGGSQRCRALAQVLRQPHAPVPYRADTQIGQPLRQQPLAQITILHGFRVVIASNAGKHEMSQLVRHFSHPLPVAPGHLHRKQVDGVPVLLAAGSPGSR